MRLAIWGRKPVPDVPQDLAARDERRFFFEWLFLSIVTIAALVFCTLTGVGASLGHLMFDRMQRLHPAVPGSDIIVIAIDDVAIDELGGWPLPRVSYARLLEYLDDPRDKPAAIGFDVLFLDSRPGDEQFATQLRKHRAYLAIEHRPGLFDGNPAVRQPSPLLANASSGLVHVNLAFESDGFIRGTNLVDGGVPHLALALSGRHDERGYVRFKLVDPAIGLPTFSLADVLSGRVPRGFFKDRFVLIGSTAPSLGDQYPTVYSGRMGAGTPGVELHANLLQGLLRNELIHQVGKPASLAFGLLAVVVVLGGLVLLGPSGELLLTVGVLAGTIGLTFLLLVRFGLWIDPSPAIIVTLLLKPAWAWRRIAMIMAFMRDRARISGEGRAEAAAGSRRFRTDLVLQTSRILDQAISTVASQRDLLRCVLDGAPSPMMVVDLLGRVTMANARMSEDFGGFLLGPQSPVSAVFAALGLDAQEEMEVLAQSAHFVTSNNGQGSERHYILRVAPLQLAQDRLWLVSLADVTEMHSLQQQRDLTLQLLSHDMRTPVASIIAICRGQLQDDGALPPESVLGVRRHTEKLLRLMDDFILSIAAESPRYSMTEAPFEFLLDEAMDQVRDLARSRGITLCPDPGEEPLFLLCDQRLMVRVLVNLLVNAVRHGEAGSQVNIGQEAVTDADGIRWIRCVVSNRVAPAESSVPAEPAARGFGLGRSFATRVVRRHGGHIQFFLPPVVDHLARVELSMKLSSIGADGCSERTGAGGTTSR